jgi:HAD superfamily hydrolase (TIGR01509 family)
MKSYVLFDHDGVLVDTERWYFRAAECALAEVGVRLDEAQYLRDMDLGRGSWVQARAAGVDDSTLEQVRERRDALYQEFLRTEDIEVEGVVDVLADLARDVRMAIVTTSRRTDFEVIHEHRRIAPWLGFVLCREDYAHAKPHPEPYVAGLRRFGADPAEAIVVEDSARGLASAVAAGIDCVVVHNDFTGGSDLSAATHRISTLAELGAIVRE